MRPLAGLFFHGATLTEREDLAPGVGVVGHAALGPLALLANLELRLGLPSPDETHGRRLQVWSQRLAALAQRQACFYASSYELDALGTATTLLSWRDLLVDAGWDGQAVPRGGARLDVFAELEREGGLPMAAADRLRRVEAELTRCRTRPWDKLELAEPREAWPGRWQRVFALLEQRGTEVSEPALALPGAAASSDLGRLQASLRGEAVAPGLRGDGSLLVLTGATSWELAHAVAAALCCWDQGSRVVLRGGDVHALDTALSAQGHPAQGLRSKSPWRPALQLLPLVLELLYTPRDPYRVLELVTLPLGPFTGWVGMQLARALSEAPGVGGRPWEAAKTNIAAEVKKEGRPASDPLEQEGSATESGARGSAATESLQRIHEWLEGATYDPEEGAPRAALLSTVARVEAWLVKRLARAQTEAAANVRGGDRTLQTLAAARAGARAMQEALEHEPRERLDLVTARQLLEEVSMTSLPLRLTEEEAGRCDLVDTPAGLRSPRDTVVWWHCVDGTQASAPLDPWRLREREALQAAGVLLRDTSRLLACEAAAWRGVLQAAQTRLVLVMPSVAQGTPLNPHPIWDELVARLAATPADLARVRLSVDDVLHNRRSLTGGKPAHTAPLLALALPTARPLWQLDAGLISGATDYSATQLDDLLGCPLRWVLRYRAGLRSGWSVSIPKGPLLNGRLGHRLVEELHLAGLLSDPLAVQEAAGRIFERLLLEEAAVLLRPGMTFELSQLRQQLVASVVGLSELLAANHLSVAGVELKTSADWGGRRLNGQLDLLLTDPAGQEVVLDAKWGRRGYAQKLERGQALQLAVYAGVRQLQSGTFPSAAYYSLSRSEVLTTDKGPFAHVRTVKGPSIASTWKRIETTLPFIERLLSAGTVPASGLHASTHLLESAGVSPPERERHFQGEPPCTYCEHGGLCGRAWQRVA